MTLHYHFNSFISLKTINNKLEVRGVCEGSISNLSSSSPTLSPHLLGGVDAGDGSHVTVHVWTEHFAHGAGRRLAAQTVDVDLLLRVFFTHELLLPRLQVQEPGEDQNLLKKTSVDAEN